MPIYFFSEDIENIKIPKKKVISWIKNCGFHYNKKIGEINYIFCSDEYLKAINIQYLKHYYYTDIITFNYNEKDILSGDIYISIDRVTENAIKFKVDQMDEILRVVIHGILHLVGFEDKTVALKNEMHDLEDHWLQAFSLI